MIRLLSRPTLQWLRTCVMPTIMTVLAHAAMLKLVNQWWTNAESIAVAAGFVLMLVTDFW